MTEMTDTARTLQRITDAVEKFSRTYGSSSAQYEIEREIKEARRTLAALAVPEDTETNDELEAMREALEWADVYLSSLDEQDINQGDEGARVVRRKIAAVLAGDIDEEKEANDG